MIHMKIEKEKVVKHLALFDGVSDFLIFPLSYDKKYSVKGVKKKGSVIKIRKVKIRVFKAGPDV